MLRVIAIAVFFQISFPGISQEIFKDEPGYDQAHGIQKDREINSELFVFRKVVPEDVAEVVSISDDDIYNNVEDELEWFGYRYNIGTSEKDLWLDSWAETIDSICCNYLLIKGETYAVYNTKLRELKKLDSKGETKVYGNYIVTTSNRFESNQFYFNSSKHKSRLNRYTFLDLNNNLEKVFEDSMTSFEYRNGYFLLINKNQPEKTILRDYNFKPVFPDHVKPVQMLGLLVVVTDINTGMVGLWRINGEEKIPITYESFDFGRSFGMLEMINQVDGKKYTDLPILWEDEYIRADRNDSSFLYNKHFELIFSEKEFRYHIEDGKDDIPYLEIRQSGSFKGIIDTNGRVIIPIDQHSINLKEDLIMVGVRGYSKGDLWTYEGKKLFDGPYDLIYRHEPGVVVFKNKGKYDFIEKTDVGKMAVMADIQTESYLTPIYYSFHGFGEGIYWFEDDEDMWYAHDGKGKMLFKIKADFIDEFEDGEAKLQVGKKTGTIDKEGNWIMPLKKR